MPESKYVHLFDIKPIMSDVEKVIQQGLNKILVNYFERYELLEKTHKQLMLLPSIADELNKTKEIKYIDITDLESNSESILDLESNSNIDSDLENSKSSVFNSFKAIEKECLLDQIVNLEEKFYKMEKKYDNIVPILDNLLNKIIQLNDDFKHFKNKTTQVDYSPEYGVSWINPSYNKQIYVNNIGNYSVIKTSENENIKIHIEEFEELKKEKISDDNDDVNPLMITCSKTSLEQEKPPLIDIIVNNEENNEELLVEEEFGIEEVKTEENKLEEEEAEEKEEASVETNSKKVIEEDDEYKENEEASVETETKEIEDENEDEDEDEDENEDEDEDKDEDEEIFEIDINDKTYCTNNHENGFIWELTEEGEQGEKIGYFKECKPFFYADKN